MTGFIGFIGFTGFVAFVGFVGLIGFIALIKPYTQAPQNHKPLLQLPARNPEP